MNSPKLSDTDLFNILANEEIQAALKGKSVDEMMPETTSEGNVIEIGSKEDMVNKFEALENIILETPPDFIIVSVFDLKCEMACSHGILVLVMILIQKLILDSLVTLQGSLLNSQEALEALEMFKSWSDSQKGDDNFNFTDLFK